MRAMWTMEWALGSWSNLTSPKQLKTEIKQDERMKNEFDDVAETFKIVYRHKTF